MFKPARHSLRIKFSLTIAVILLVIFTAASLVRIRETTKFQKDSLYYRSETFAELATKPLGDAYLLYNNSGILKLNEIFEQTLSLDVAFPRIQIISINGEILYDSKDVDGTDNSSRQEIITDKDLLSSVSSNEITKIKDGAGDVTEIVVPYSDSFGSRPFSLRYFISYDIVNASVRQAVLTTVILNILVFFFALLTLTFLVDRSILSPLSKITEAARVISNGDLNKNIAVHTNDELSDLAVSLNLMTTKLKNNIYKLQRTEKLKDEFITIASHNLRTPLTIIKGYLPTLKEKKLDAEEGEVISHIEKSVEKLNSITESLLNIVSLEDSDKPLKKVEEDIVQILKTIIDNYKSKASEKQINFSLNFSNEKVFIPLDKIKITQAITNIIDNSIKFNKDNGVVTVDLTALNNEVILCISDTGIGLTPENLHDIFARFHRGTDIYTYDYEGIGLSLYLSKIIIEAHSGRIWVTSKMSEGTNVYISLPRSDRPKA